MVSLLEPTWSVIVNEKLWYGLGPITAVWFWGVFPVDNFSLINPFFVAAEFHGNGKTFTNCDYFWAVHECCYSYKIVHSLLFCFVNYMYMLTFTTKSL